MLAVVFNSLLILMAVVGAKIITQAYAQATFTEAPSIEAIDQTRRNMDNAFEAVAPRNADDRYEFWQDIVQRELAEKDVSAARGFLLAAPQMLDRDSVRELLADADGIALDRADERLAAAALRKLPLDVGLLYEEALVSARIVDAQTEIPEEADTALSAPDTIADENAEPVETTAPQVSLIEQQTQVERRFRLLGTFTDLANNSERWVHGERADTITLKITAIGLIGAETSDGVSDTNLRAASVLKSARRARRLTPEFVDYISERIDAALPDDNLRPALEAALGGLAKTEVRVERVREAYVNAIDPNGLEQLEADLAQIDRISTLTSPSAAISLIETAKSGSDLRRIRLIVEAGSDRAVALVKQIGGAGLDVADTGVRWTDQLTLRLMSLTAAALAMIYVTVLTFRRNVRLPKKRIEPAGI